MGHPTLEAPGVLPSTPGAQMATHAGSSSGHPLQRYLRALPSGVGLNGLAPAILAGSHDSQSVWGPLLSSEQSCQHPHLGLGH